MIYPRLATIKARIARQSPSTFMRLRVDDAAWLVAEMESLLDEKATLLRKLAVEIRAQQGKSVMP